MADLTRVSIFSGIAEQQQKCQEFSQQNPIFLLLFTQYDIWTNIREGARIAGNKDLVERLRMIETYICVKNNLEKSRDKLECHKLAISLFNRYKNGTISEDEAADIETLQELRQCDGDVESNVVAVFKPADSAPVSQQGQVIQLW